MRRKKTLGVAVVSAALLLTACANSSSYAALDREAKSSDVLPTVVSDSDNQIISDSSRLVGEQDGVSLWLAKGSEPDVVCLVVYPNDEEWAVTCGGAGAVQKLTGPSGGYVLAPDGMPTPEGGTQLSENVFSVPG